MSNGDRLEPPALDALPSYPLTIAGNDILVQLPEEPARQRTPEMSGSDPKADARVFVIIGGGAAGYSAAQTLREEGFEGRIIMITKEDRAPYDRPNLSKDYLQGGAEPEWMPLRPDDFFDDHGIEIIRNRVVTGVDAASKTITFEEGESLPYDKVLMATGGEPRRLDLPGSDLKNIFVLRSFDDADAIIETAKGAKKAVVIGSSFIGMEAAFSLKQRGLSVTVIAPGNVPFEKNLGNEIGAMFQRVHENNGVDFRLGASVVNFEGDGKVSAAVISTGERIEADLVIAGIGVSPATKFLDGLNLHKDGGVITDKYLQAGKDIYAAGDIAHFPDVQTGEDIRIEHWRTALQQGQAAARNMLDKEIAFTSVPFFWTTQFDVTLNYVGHAKDWDEIFFRGDVDQHDFLAFYIKNGRVSAVAGMNRDRELDVLEELFRQRQMPGAQEIKDGFVF